MTLQAPASSPDVDGKIFLGRVAPPPAADAAGAPRAGGRRQTAGAVVDAGEYLTLRLANRHGLVTGATGTGKTVTLQVLAEGFSRAGVPVFAADIKGDLSGVAAPGEAKDFVVSRAAEVGITYTPDSFPVIFWDVFGAQGHPVRATVSEMGPLLLARLMNLNDIQEGVLNIVFRVADEQGLLLLDLKDLRAMLAHVAENAASLAAQYGNVSAQSVGAIQRQLLMLENQGADKFFGEPALDIRDLMRIDRSGYGTISVLAADKLMGAPRLYACFLLWLLAELFEQLPEVGDPDKPKLVFFFDEAHLLFDEAPKILLEKVEQVVRLIRSKGVGVYFVTQNPLDVPESVLAQLGQPGAACAARLHPARPEGGPGRRRDLPPQSGPQHRPGHHGTGQGRGVDLHPGRQRRAVHGAAHIDPAALGPGGPPDAGRARGHRRPQPGGPRLRHRGGPRIGV